MADEEQLAKIRMGVVEWNAWRKADPEVTVDLVGAKLTDTDLAGADLAKAILIGAKLTGANLTDADLSEATLVDANIEGADLTKADLTEATLAGANIEGADLTEAKFTRANVRSAKLKGATLTRVEFTDADLHSAEFTETRFTDVDLSGANLSEARLDKTIHVDTGFADANLIGADLSGAKFLEGDFRSADFRGANLEEANLAGADLSNLDLSAANLCRAVLEGANLNGADLSGANLKGAKLTRANAAEAKLTQANLSNADLTEANLIVANLIGSILDHANVTGAKLWETQRTDWSIKGISCEYAYWDEGEIRIDYAPGEFEKLFAEAERIILEYPDGIEPIEVTTLPLLIEHIQRLHEGTRLRFKSIEASAGGTAVTIIVEHDEEGRVAEGDIANMKTDIEKLKKQLRQLLGQEDKKQIIEELQTQFMKGIFSELGEYLKLGQASQETHYHIKGHVGVAGDVGGNATLNFTYSETDISKVGKLIKEIDSKYTELKKDVSQKKLRKIESSIKTIESQINAATPDSSTIKKALGSMARIFENASGNVLASGWLNLLQPFI